MEEKTYKIFTDASFDDITKIGTYAIVIMQEQKVVSINKVFQILISLNVLEKVKNGKYALLI